MIKSILDNDLYKFTMQLAVLELFPNAEAEYRFTNRGHQRFSEEFVEELERIINEDISGLKLVFFRNSGLVGEGVLNFKTLQ